MKATEAQPQTTDVGRRLVRNTKRPPGLPDWRLMERGMTPDPRYATAIAILAEAAWYTGYANGLRDKASEALKEMGAADAGEAEYQSWRAE